VSVCVCVVCSITAGVVVKSTVLAVLSDVYHSLVMTRDVLSLSARRATNDCGDHQRRP